MRCGACVTSGGESPERERGRDLEERGLAGAGFPMCVAFALAVCACAGSRASFAAPFAKAKPHET